MGWEETRTAIERVPKSAAILMGGVNNGNLIQAKAVSPVPGGAELHDPGVVGPGLLFGAGAYLGALAELAKRVAEDGINRDWQAAPLLRSMFDYVVTFCWLAAAPTDDRALGWVAEDKRQRIATDGDIKRVKATAGLDASTRAAFEVDVQAARAAGTLAPGVPERARQADLHWASILDEFKRHPGSQNPGALSDAYPTVYRRCSSIGHPTPQALMSCFVQESGRAGEFLIATDRESSSQYFYTQGPINFAFAVLVAGQLYSWVDASCVDAAFSWA